MEYKFINDILEQLLEDSFSIFCGAGATADVTCIKWEDIFSKTTKNFILSNVSNDIYFLADLEKNYYNKDKFYEDIRNKLDAVKNKHSSHIDHIIELNLNQIWTTNFDEIIENSIIRKFAVTPTVLVSSQDLLYKKLNANYVVYKLNGSASCPDTMVLTKTDFYNYFKKQRLFFELLKRQLVLDSFLFVGYSFQDDLVLNALREIKEIFPQNGKTHYRFFVPNFSSDKSTKAIQQSFYKYEQDYFRDKYNIETIPLSRYDEIDKYLEELYRRFCNYNILFSGSFRAISNDLRIEIENIVDKLIESLYLNNFNVYSGNGRGLGEIIVARASLHKKTKRNRFVNRPLIFTGDSIDDKTIKNKQIDKDCNTMIIICGQDDSLEPSKNVLAQYNQFISSDNKLVIPIPVTGYAANTIFEMDSFKDSFYFQTAKTQFLSLAVSNNPDEIAKIVTKIILTFRKESV